MVGLEDIRRRYEELAKANTTSNKTYTVSDGTYSGTFPVTAFKTGNLRSSIRVLIKSKDAGRAVLDLVAVRYSVFLNSGFLHWRSKKVVRRPFAVEAANSKELKQVIGDYGKSTQAGVVVEQLEIVKSKLSNFGLGPKISPNSKTKRYSYP